MLRLIDIAEQAMHAAQIVGDCRDLRMRRAIKLRGDRHRAFEEALGFVELGALDEIAPGVIEHGNGSARGDVVRLGVPACRQRVRQQFRGAIPASADRCYRT